MKFMLSRLTERSWQSVLLAILMKKILGNIIKGFGKDPNGSVLLAEYRCKPIFISLALCRYSGFLIAVIPYCPTESVLRYLEIAEADDVLVSDELKRNVSAKRITQTDLDAATEALSILRIPNAAIGVISKISATELMRRISLSAESIADQVGCRISVTRTVILEDLANFDICFFEVFMLCFSMLVRRVSPV